MKIKELLKPLGIIKNPRVFVNKRNGQMTVILPKRKMKKTPTKLEISYW